MSKTMQAWQQSTILVMVAMLLISPYLQAQTGTFGSTFSPRIPKLKTYAEQSGDPCTDGSPYFEARLLGREAYADRHNQDLLEILVENKPKIIDVYGKCIEALNMIDSISALFNPSIYVNLISIQALKKLIYEQVVDAICEEIQEEAEEVYGAIADKIPLGNYVYELDEVFAITASFN